MFKFLAALPKIAYLIRGAVLRFLILLAGGQCGPGCRLEKGLRIRQGLHKGWNIGANVYFGRNITIDCLPTATLEIGDNVTLTEGIFMSMCEGISIGSNALIGEYSSIRDANHDISNPERLIVDQPMVAGRVKIGSDVWIGRGCAILAGVNVGQGSVIGANSVVNKDLREYAISAGVPAKFVRVRPRF